MNKFVPRGYLTLKKALEHFGKLKHADKWEAEKASSQQEFQQLLFEETVPAELFTDYGDLKSLPSRDWGGVGAERIFETERSSISGGDYYLPDEVRGRVLIKKASIDALFDGDSDEVETGPSEIGDERRHKLNSKDREKSRQLPRHRTHLQTVINKIVAEIKVKVDGAIGP